MNTTTIEVAPGVTRPAVFTSLADWQAWRNTHARRIIARDEMEMQARTVAARDMGLKTQGDMRKADARTREEYRGRVQTYLAQIASDAHRANVEAAAFNARLSLNANDIRAIRDTAENGEARQRQAVADAEPLNAAPHQVTAQQPTPEQVQEANERAQVYRGMTARDLACIRARQAVKNSTCSVH